MSIEYKEEEDIPLLNELIDNYNEGKYSELSNECWMRFYPTKFHKEGGEKYSWIMPLSELIKYSAINIDFKLKMLQ